MPFLFSISVVMYIIASTFLIYIFLSVVVWIAGLRRRLEISKSIKEQETTDPHLLGSVTDKVKFFMLSFLIISYNDKEYKVWIPDAVCSIIPLGTKVGAYPAFYESRRRYKYIHLEFGLLYGKE